MNSKSRKDEDNGMAPDEDRAAPQANTASICKFLRAKNGIGNLEGGENPWRLLDKVTTTFTCLCTGEPFGPDYGLAEAARCTAERGCWSSPAEKLTG